MSGRGRKSKISAPRKRSCIKMRKQLAKELRGGRPKQMDKPHGDGIHSTMKLTKALGNLIGSNAEVHTVDDKVFNGIFATCSSSFEVVLDSPTLVSKEEPAIALPQEVYNKSTIYPSEDIVYLKVASVDFEHGTAKGFQVDESITSKGSSGVKEREMKELEPWSADGPAEELPTLGADNANGWDPDEMFKRNEENHGVTSTYTPDMAGYTTPLNKRNTKEWNEKEARAHRIAQEIQNNPWTAGRAELENGDDEEACYSAVVRPDQASQDPNQDVYMPPQKRRQQPSRPMQRPPTTAQCPTPTAYSAQITTATSAFATSTGPSQRQRHAVENRLNGESQDVRRSDSAQEQNREAHKMNQSREYANAKPVPEKQPEPKEQRRRAHKEEQFAKLKEFGKSFNLSESSEKSTPPPPPPADVTEVKPAAKSTPPLAEENAPVIEAHSNPGSPGPQSSLNPLAKVFVPRGAPSEGSDTRDPTPAPSPGSAHVVPPPQQMPGLIQPVNYPNVMHGSYVMSQVPVQPQARYQKRGTLVHNVRPEYASPIQVANATGPPLLTHGAGGFPPQQVQIQGGMVPQQNHYPYQVNQMLVRYPTGTPIIPSQFMTPGGIFHQGEVPQGQPHGQQQPIYYAASMHPSHPTPGHTPHPPQVPTPQGHNGNNHGHLPNQPPTPGPTPPSMMYAGAQGPLSGQNIPQHLAQPNTPSHGQYIGPGIPPMYMVPQQSMSLGMPPPHSVGGPSSVSGYTATSSTLVSQFNPPPVHLYQGAPQPQGHGMPLGPNNH